ncbi:MAG TPA: hypothetical protein VMN79_10270 [Casimicrobiaceae bacterium]|nr:hypothetical protein [Casimicrobiaceae bacterium]
MRRLAELRFPQERRFAVDVLIAAAALALWLAAMDWVGDIPHRLLLPAILLSAGLILEPNLFALRGLPALWRRSEATTA